METTIPDFRITEWARHMRVEYPDLRHLYVIPQTELCGRIIEVPQACIFLHRGPYRALFAFLDSGPLEEMLPINVLRRERITEMMMPLGYLMVSCHDFGDAVSTIIAYLNLPAS